MSGTVEETVDGSRLVLRDTLVPNPKQQLFWQTCALPYRDVEEVLFDGSIRGGKTQAAGKLIVGWAMRDGGTYVVSRFSYRELEDSTKKAFLYGDGGLPPLIPKQLLRGGSLDRAKNETHNKVTLVNGAEILFRALEPRERGKIRNLTACAWFIDQAEELDGEEIEDFYQEIKGRCSDPRGTLKVILVANPGPTDHMIYSRFIDPVTRYAKGRRIHVSILDNQMYLPPHYVEMLLATEHTNPDYFKRMVMGEWGAIGGKRFKWFRRDTHVCEPFDIPDGWEILEGWDYGWSNPAVQLLVAIDYSGRAYVVSEYRATETPIPQLAEHAKRIRGDYREGGGEEPPAERPFFGSLAPEAGWLDPSAWAKKGEYEAPANQMLEEGLMLARANNERLGGWARLDTWGTTMMDDGRPKLQIFSTCEGLIKEFPNAAIKAGTVGDIAKVNDHSLDALRYIAMSRPQTPQEQQQEEGGTREAAARTMVKNRSGERKTEELYVG